MNDIVLEMSRLQSTGVPMLQVSPYDIRGPEAGKRRFGNRSKDTSISIRFRTSAAWKLPELVLGTVNIYAGMFETFTSEEVTSEAILASAPVPAVFEAVEINGPYHWDGLFSQNSR